MLQLLHKTINAFVERRLKRVRRFLDDPIEIQNEQFEQLIIGGRNTIWGREHNYEDIKTIADFQKTVPFSTYEDLFPWIDRAMHGENDVLWTGDIEWFAKSSGTTNDASKYIPMSRDSIHDCHRRGGLDMWALYIKNNPQSCITGGKTIGIGGSIDNQSDFPHIKSGDLSAVIMKNLPKWVEFLRTPDIETATLPHWETKLEKLARATMHEDIRSIAGVPTWTILLIKKVVELSGKNNITEVWKNLEVFFHGGVSFEPYRELFKELIPSDKMHYLELYNASEGFFAIQDDLDKKGEMLLMLDYGVFYEFIPMDVFGTDRQYAITLADVEIGKNYAIVVSTNGGLWRYIIGDTVTFTSLEPYRIKITGRTKHFINAFGEELVVGNADMALQYACQKTGAQINDYTAAPVFMKENNTQGGHEWVIEFEQEPNSIIEFSQTLDVKLQELNSDYAAKRRGDMALVFPAVHIAPQGTFYNWMKQRGKLGGQHKVPRLSNDRLYVDDVLKLL